MGDSYQAFYDAARRAIGSVDVDSALQNAFDISNQKHIALDVFMGAVSNIETTMTAPHVVLRAKIEINMGSAGGWICKYGDLEGSGPTPAAAAERFDKLWKGTP